MRTAQFEYDHAERLVHLAGSDSMEVYSTRRQFERYTNFFWEIQEAMGPVVSVAEAVLGKLPHNPKFE